MEKNVIIEELLGAWEETYKKGQLTFWVFLALSEGSKCVEEIKEFVEVAACGTAVVVTPVWEITRGDDVIVISDKDAVGEHLQKLYETVQGIQYGVLEDVHGWCHEVSL